MTIYKTPDLPAGKSARLEAAVGAAIGLGRSATPAEVEGKIVELLRQIVRDQEQMADIAALPTRSPL